MGLLSGLHICSSSSRRGFDGFFRQTGHEFFQSLPIFGRKGDLQAARKRALQASLPTGAQVVQISTPAIHLPGWVYEHSLGLPYNTGQSSFGQHGATANAGSLWNMFRRFPGHATSLHRSNQHHRACVSCGQLLHRDLRQIDTQPTSCPSCPSCPIYLLLHFQGGRFLDAV